MYMYFRFFRLFQWGSCNIEYMFERAGPLRPQEQQLRSAFRIWTLGLLPKQHVLHQKLS